MRRDEINSVLMIEEILHHRNNETTSKITIEQKIYVSKAHMSDNYECPSRDFGDSL